MDVETIENDVSEWIQNLLRLLMAVRKVLNLDPVTYAPSEETLYR